MLLIKNGSVHLQKGGVLRGHDILTDGKVIKRIGKNLEAGGADVIDASGLDIYPGFVLAVSSVGAHGFSEKVNDESETSSPFNPQLNIEHSLDIREVTRQRFRRCGITSYGLSPGTVSLVGGQMAVINTDGSRTEDLILIRKAALKANYTGDVKELQTEKKATPRTRMAMYFALDDGFRAAREYMEKDKKDYDEKNEVLARVLRGEIPFFVNAYMTHEIESMITLAEKHSLRLVINGAFGVEDCAERVMRNGYHVVLGELTYLLDALRNGTNLENLVSLYRKGLNLSLATSNDTAYPAGYEQILWSAGLMYRAGATGDEVIDMITINPAKALGADHLVGSLEEGKHADIVIANGNPVTRYDSRILYTVVAGKVSYRKEGM